MPFSLPTGRPPAHPRNLTRIVLFGVSKAFVTECEALGGDFATAYVLVRNLQAACRALAEVRVDMLVISRGLPSWDRTVVEEHAKSAGVPIHFVSPDDGVSAWPVVLECERLRPKHLRYAPAARRGGTP